MKSLNACNWLQNIVLRVVPVSFHYVGYPFRHINRMQDEAYHVSLYFAFVAVALIGSSGMRLGVAADCFCHLFPYWWLFIGLSLSCELELLGRLLLCFVCRFHWWILWLTFRYLMQSTRISHEIFVLLSSELSGRVGRECELQWEFNKNPFPTLICGYRRTFLSYSSFCLSCVASMLLPPTAFMSSTCSSILSFHAAIERLSAYLTHLWLNDQTLRQRAALLAILHWTVKFL